MPRSVWCVGFAPDGQVVVAAIDSAGRWLQVATVPEPIVQQTREAIRAMLDARDPAPPEAARPALGIVRPR